MKIKRIFGALGFAALAATAAGCKVMYGCPHSDYEIKGKVQDEEGSCIRGIEVSIVETGEKIDTTDADGNFQFKGDMVFMPEQVTLQAKDIDGTENELYKTKEVTVTFEQTKKGDGDWYGGTFAAEATITMERATDDEEE